MTLKERLLRYWTYFRQGHNSYLVFFISFANFIVIQYALLIEYVPLLKAIFANLTAFVLAVVVIYVPLATVVGWLDYRRLAVPVDLAMGALASPYARDFARALMLMCDGKYDEAKNVLEKWLVG